MESFTELSKTFMKTIADYNSNTFLWQIVFYFIGVVVTGLLYNRPSERRKKTVKLYLAACYLWISVVFFARYGSAEFHKGITAVYFGLISLLFFIDSFIGKIELQRNKRYDKLVLVLFVLFLLYPIVGLLLGRRFPEISMWLMPCPLTVFTITLLTSFLSAKEKWIYILPLLWALPGLPKSFLFNIQEDLILGIAGVAGVVVLVLEHRNSNRNKSTT